MVRSTSAAIAWLIVAAFLFACGSSAGSSDPGSDSDGSDSGDASTDPEPEDTGVDADVGTLDSGTPDLGAPDVDEGLPPGAECTENEDCATALCVDVFVGDEGSGLCSNACLDDSDCPEDFDCVFLSNSGGDSQQICLPVDLCVDEDEDGFGFGPGCDGPDCDDQDETANPVYDEICDGVDNDCDGTIDDNPVGTNDDCDPGFAGECAAGRTVCEGGLFACEPRVEPIDETCNGLDDDCDGMTDEDETGEAISRDCYDGDPALLGIGACTGGAQICGPGGFSGCIGQVLPGPEVCDLVDNDCDGMVDEDSVAVPWYPDTDMDGFGADVMDPMVTCTPPPGYVENNTDCDDNRADSFPGAMEIPGDGIDQSCDGTEICYEDEDDDGYHSGGIVFSDDNDCNGPGEARSTEPGGDCEDDDALTYPGADEIIGDEIDNNCDGIEICWEDEDGDGFHAGVQSPSLDFDCSDPGEGDLNAEAGDCDDDESAAFPGNPETCDGIDNDCDLRIDEGAGCYMVGEPCEDDIDCVSLLCEDGFCADNDPCPGCPDRVGQTFGGGTRTSPSYRMEVTVGAPTTTYDRTSTNYQMNVGVGLWRLNP